jgi:hypothetical protein
VAKKPFHINYKILTPDGFVVLNGDQIVKITAQKMPKKGWKVIFHLADGTTQVVTSEWATAFVKEIEELQAE